MEVKILTLTDTDLEDLLTKVYKKGRVDVTEELNTRYETPQELTALLESFFPSYNTPHWIVKIKKAIKANEVGRIDRFNRYMVSHSELSKYLFK